VNEPVLGYFPEINIANRDADKEAITLEDLPTMQNNPPSTNEARRRDTVVRPRIVLSIYAALLTLYVAVLHPWLINWNTSEAEQRTPLAV
jgi:hypothetical protein